ncbi:MAG: 3-phosphoshikimate 1-carboxyvinyltransferase [Bdellovibrionales bacterium GWC1_52_8]|nr:MAG: 3-phosphoshikimate 1-carboxyvinyltransferase [Bdellovibrionales bacterium GWB1_52_6]OFZ04739.1 MAG: 3-phosphoshikimate 1-carboxyvinyltransferase [Bdellovibrionales bacterium GWA1_52_35]OFZ35660.1 MAG: 3-phosphoshikimate 1-carboxyvinyltransferase [Bdellovibrionales bacterium GWC1_52_8]HCM39552.1 3-phosphoshikimate 1-carboxyvinyltransferase [Bdellovibrionales bacterium]
MTLALDPVQQIQGTIEVPGDKSVSHRSLVFGAIAEGVTEVSGILNSADVRSTETCLSALGVSFIRREDKVLVHGRGLHGLQVASHVLDCGNSGTTTRILMGLLAGQAFDTVLTGDESIQRRPMKRAAEPLREMGARMDLIRGEFAPITIHGSRLRSIDYSLKVASAQVKTALLMAGLYAEGTTTIRGQIASRDHTERMLPHFGVKLEMADDAIRIRSGQRLSACPIRVPGDPSSAAFWMGAACLVRGSTLEIRNVSLNPTRIGLMKVLARMGASIDVEQTETSPEPSGHIRISAPHGLRGTEVLPSEVPSMVDEIPLLAVIASQAEGETIVHGAEELRVKESDRIVATVTNLRAMGIEIESFQDGYRLRGPQRLVGAKIDSFLDHRIAMSFAIASLVARGRTEILRPDCVDISYPEFFQVLQRIGHA